MRDRLPYQHEVDPDLARDLEYEEQVERELDRKEEDNDDD